MQNQILAPPAQDAYYEGPWCLVKTDGSPVLHKGEPMWYENKQQAIICAEAFKASVKGFQEVFYL